jgi:hypothetical protein
VIQKKLINISVNKNYNTRVSSIIVKHEGIKKYAIIDTESNISFIFYIKITHILYINTKPYQRIQGFLYFFAACKNILCKKI